MNKKGVILLSLLVIGVVSGLVTGAFTISSTSETVNLDVDRTHGTISTTLGSPILGDPLAPATIVEFGDYQCPQCRKWFDNTRPELIEQYIETRKANLVFVDLAFLGNDSINAAQASYCAEDQGAYWKYHDTLYSSQKLPIDGGWANTEQLKMFASGLDLDMELFESCLDSEKYLKRVQYNSQQARDNGVTGTPGFFLVTSNGDQVQLAGAQPFVVFQKILDSAT